MFLGYLIGEEAIGTAMGPDTGRGARVLVDTLVPVNRHQGDFGHDRTDYLRNEVLPE